LVAAVVFDLDGVLLDSEPVWEVVRRGYVEQHGGRWTPEVQRRLMGMSTEEWSTYLSDVIGNAASATEVRETVVGEMRERYQQELPLMPHARATVADLAASWPLGMASASPRMLVDVVVDQAGLTERFAVTVSADEVSRGKPAPDVYLLAASRLGVSPEGCVAVEDSSNGLRAASAAGMTVVAVPHPRYPPAAEALARADLVLPDLAALGPSQLESLEKSSNEE
jgi:HAD superfamily hydrolase (TIGR01509 family)